MSGRLPEFEGDVWPPRYSPPKITFAHDGDQVFASIDATSETQAMVRELVRRLHDVQDRALSDALIALGWTPPDVGPRPSTPSSDSGRGPAP